MPGNDPDALSFDIDVSLEDEAPVPQVVEDPASSELAAELSALLRDPRLNAPAVALQGRAATQELTAADLADADTGDEHTGGEQPGDERTGGEQPGGEHPGDERAGERGPAAAGPAGDDASSWSEIELAALTSNPGISGFGEYLIDLGALTRGQLYEALMLKDREKMRLGEAAVALGFITPPRMLRLLRRYGATLTSGAGLQAQPAEAEAEAEPGIEAERDAAPDAEPTAVRARPEPPVDPDKTPVPGA